MPVQNVYDLTSPTAPRVSGVVLKFLTWLADLPLIRMLVSRRLLRDNGVYALREDQDLERCNVVFHPLDHPSAQHGPAFDGGLAQAKDAAEGAGQNPVQDLTPAVELVQAVSGTPVRTGFQFWSIMDYHSAYKAGTTTPVAVAERIIRYIKDSQSGNRKMNIMLAYDEEVILKMAADSLARWESGDVLGVLDGVPVAVKDEINVQGYRTTLGTKFMSDIIGPVKDAPIVANLRAQGVVFIGKTNQIEFGLGVLGGNQNTGAVRNPYGLQRYTGGSSSGSAAVVAAGLCPIALGADAGGSVRLPAGICGVVGIKPSYGRASCEGIAKAAPSAGTAGILAANVLDAVVAYQAIAGASITDGRSLLQPSDILYCPIKSDNPLQGLKIGVFDAWFNDTTPEVNAITTAFLDTLTNAGATKVDISIPFLDSVRIANMITVLCEIYHIHIKTIREHYGELTPDTKVAFFCGRYLTKEDYFQACLARDRLMKNLAELFRDVDVIMTPISAIPAPELRESVVNGCESDIGIIYKLSRFVAAFNVSGHPAIALPVGYTQNGGLPVGMQFVTRHWEEGALFRIARAVEKLVEKKRPAVFYDNLGD